MNKNIIIGVLFVVVLIGLGFYFIRNKDEVVVAPTVDTSASGLATTPTEPVATPVVATLVPAAPTVLTNQNSSVSSSTASLAGSVQPNGANATYWFDYGISTALGNESVAQAIGSGYATIPATGFISGLSANTLYYFRLSAKNSFATVHGALYTFQTNSTPAPKTIKTTVNTNAATNVSNIVATVNGQVNPNGTATSYWYEYGTSTKFGSTTMFQGTSSGITFLSVPVGISGLQPLTKYYFRLNAENQFGVVNGTTLSFTTIGPATPSQPKVQTTNATSINSSSATLVGRLNSNSASTAYWFEYGNNSLLNSLIGSTQQVIVAGSASEQSVNAKANNLQSSTRYYYRLVARNQFGTIYGNIVSFTTKK